MFVRKLKNLYYNQPLKLLRRQLEEEEGELFSEIELEIVQRKKKIATIISILAISIPLILFFSVGVFHAIYRIIINEGKLIFSIFSVMFLVFVTIVGLVVFLNFKLIIKINLNREVWGIFLNRKGYKTKNVNGQSENISTLKTAIKYKRQTYPDKPHFIEKIDLDKDDTIYGYVTQKILAQEIRLHHNFHLPFWYKNGTHIIVIIAAMNLLFLRLGMIFVENSTWINYIGLIGSIILIALTIILWIMKSKYEFDPINQYLQNNGYDNLNNENVNKITIKLLMERPY